MSDWLISSARLRTGKHPENIDVSDIFSWSTYVSHKYMLSFLSSLSELHVVSKWLFTWYRNDFHFNSGMSFVPECSSYFIHKIERLSLRRSRSRGVFAPDQVQMRHLPQATRFAIFNPERSLFSVYIIPEWNFLDQEREFHSQWKPEWIRAWVSSDPSWINQIKPHVLWGKNLLVPYYSWDQCNWLAFQSRSKHGKRHRRIPRLDQSNSCLKQANHMWRKLVKSIGKWNSVWL